MESLEKTETPRRSTRLLRQRAVTPDLQIIGPRELMKFNKSRQKFEFDQSSSSKILPEINIIPSTPVSTKKRRHTHNSTTSKKTKADDIKEIEKLVEADSKDENKVAPTETQDPIEEKNLDAEITESKTDNNEARKSINQNQKPKIDKNEVKENINQNQEPTVQSPTENEEFHSAINENIEDKSSDKTIEASSKNDSNGKDEDENAQDASKQDEVDKVKEEQEEKAEFPNQEIKLEATNLDQTPQLMDESIISVPESPSMISTAVVKDSTFSPEVDTSIKDTRPHIDNILTPIIPRNVTLRTSTPLSQRVLMRDTPKLSFPVISALKKVLSPKIGENKKLNEESLNETFNSQFKMGNPLEKSILKSSRRKRSLSVADGESFMQKKVNFVSPQIMNIESIDEKMLQSFKEERENSMIQQALASGGGMRRKRSLSETGTPAKAKIKVPNFKAIHEQQFRKMESIVDHAQRKADRAKRLATPSKISSLPKIKETTEHNAVSKIPTRKPLTKVSSSENILHGIKSRTIKRSLSADTHPKSSAASKIPTIKEAESKVGSAKKILPRILDTNTKVTPVPKFTAIKKPTVATSIPKPGPSVQSMRSKVEERRERNMSLYKGNSVRTGLDHRKKNDNVLKGVRLNRRFELQMQHRRMEENED
ncbi:general transcriptional corepressor trfA [Chironomus tepperi]|uniref:general transcriptional corepressor trfA n=1 Tax=Chironomus tepperi TaxID=113505 RepID=UPI00391F57C3